MANDIELLRSYAKNGDEAAFTELVHRHLDLVHAAARRQCVGAQQAEDVAQAVFTELARKAARLCDRDELVGWLFVSTRYAALKLIRGEARRAKREWKAAMEDQLNRDEDEPIDWARLQPELDAALAELREGDRVAVLLRVFEGRSFAEVGAALRTTAEGARKRVDRSMERLRARLARRGITSTAAALSVALAGSGAVAAPAGLAATISGAALAAVPAVGYFGTLAAGLQLMCGTKTAVAAATVAAALCVGVAVQQAAALYDVEASVVAAKAEGDAQRARLADLDARIETEESARRLAMRARPNRAVAGTTARRQIERQIEREIERGAEFLAAYPQARALFDTIWRAQKGLQLELLARELQLTAEQRGALDRFLRSDASFPFQLPDGERVRLKAVENSLPQTRQARARSEAELAAALGDKANRLRSVLVECRRLEGVHETVNQIAGLAAGSGAPLSPSQTGALTRFLDERAEAATLAGSPLSLPDEDWRSLRREAAEVLAAPQLEVLDLLRLRTEYNLRIQFAQAAAKGDRQ